VTRTWDIHGIRVRMESELGVPGVLDYGLRHHRVDGDGAVDIELSVRVADGVAPLVEGVRVSFRRPLPVDGVVAEDRFWLRAGHGTMSGDLGAGIVEVAAPDADWLAEPTVVRTLLPLGLMMPLARRGLFYVHAAIVVDPSGEGWMLVGGGDVGKSTTTYRLLERGWSWLCDDGGLLRDDGRIVALSFWDELQLDRAMVARLDSVTWEERPASHEHKGVVATDRRFPGRRLERAEVSHLVVLNRGEPDSRTVVPPTRAEVLAGLVDDNPLMLVNATEPNFDVFARLVAQCDLGRVWVSEATLRDPEAELRQAFP